MTSAVWIVLALGGLASGAVSEAKKSFPREVLLLRHAEKPAEDDPSVDLSEQGRKRATALPELFQKSASRPKPFPEPDFIFAAKDSRHSHRPLETVSPLAKKFKLNVHAEFADDQFTDLARELLSNSQYAGKTVLVCWHHGNLPGLARALGATGVPAHFKGTAFDRVWRISYDKKGQATFSDLPQSLLPGDAEE